jgi:hypothetical protein
MDEDEDEDEESSGDEAVDIDTPELVAEGMHDCSYFRMIIMVAQMHNIRVIGMPRDGLGMEPRAD